MNAYRQDRWLNFEVSIKSFIFYASIRLAGDYCNETGSEEGKEPTDGAASGA